MMTEEERKLYQETRQHEENVYQLAKDMSAIGSIREERVRFIEYMMKLKDELKCLDDILWKQRLINVEYLDKFINRSKQTEEAP